MPPFRRSPASAAMSRRTFLSVSSVATVATAMPAAATTLCAPETLALASRRGAVPMDWSGPVMVLSGDYSARLAAVRDAMTRAAGRPVSLFLDGADAVLFDIATLDQRPHLRPVLAAAVPSRMAAGASA